MLIKSLKIKRVVLIYNPTLPKTVDYKKLLIGMSLLRISLELL